MRSYLLKKLIDKLPSHIRITSKVSYELVYIDYDSNLDDSLKSVNEAIQKQDWCPLDESQDEWMKEWGMVRKMSDDSPITATETMMAIERYNQLSAKQKDIHILLSQDPYFIMWVLV